MKVGDLITHARQLHIVIEIKHSTPVARVGLEELVLKNTKTLETRTIPMKWIRSLK
jgi:hypothetical protein